MEIAFTLLRMAPRDFWAMTLAEWDAAYSGLVKAGKLKSGGGDTNAVNGGMSGSRLDELMARYPDTAPDP